MADISYVYALTVVTMEFTAPPPPPNSFIDYLKAPFVESTPYTDVSHIYEITDNLQNCEQAEARTKIKHDKKYGIKDNTENYRATYPYTRSFSVCAKIPPCRSNGLNQSKKCFWYNGRTELSGRVNVYMPLLREKSFIYDDGTVHTVDNISSGAKIINSDGQVTFEPTLIEKIFKFFK